MKLGKLVKRSKVFLVVMSVIFLTNAYMILATKDRIYSDATNISQDYQAAIVLGAGVRNNQPTLILKDRLDAGIELYKKGCVPKIIMSGIDTTGNDRQVSVMSQYAQTKGVPLEAIIEDRAGYITHASAKRAHEFYHYDKVVMVTQKYHLYRAIYVSEKEGLTVCGYTADKEDYPYQWLQEIREILARTKNFFALLV